MRVAQCLGGRKIDDLERPAVRIRRLRQDLPQIGHDGVIGMRLVGLLMQQEPARRGKGGDDVNMARGAEVVVIAGQPARQPDRVSGAKQARHLFLDPAAVRMGIAVGVQLNRFGQKHACLRRRHGCRRLRSPAATG